MIWPSKKKQLKEIDDFVVDSIVRGKVKEFTPFGAYIDIEGVTAKLNREEISWSHPGSMMESDVNDYDKIFNDLYSNWDWVYGKSPKSTIQKRKHFDFGTIDARLLIENGKIANVKFYGDFFGSDDANQLAEKLVGTVYDREHLASTLEPIDTTSYFTGIPKTELVELLAQ